MRAPAPTWGAELAAYEHEKRRVVDEGFLRGPPQRLPPGFVQEQDRVFDPLLQKFRDPGTETRRQSDEARGRVAHLNRAQDIQILREQPYNIVTHDSKLEGLAPGQDPTRLCGHASKRARGRATCPSAADKDFHIVSNLPAAEHSWKRPEDRPPIKEQTVSRRKLHAHLIKDFNIVTNRYAENHQEKEQQAKRLNLLESTQKYMRQNRFDPVTQQFNDPRREELVRVADHAREAEIVMRAESMMPPSFKGRQSAHYGIISHEVKNEDMIRMWDEAEEERNERYRNRYLVEHNVHVQDISGNHSKSSRQLNRIAPERFEEAKRRGYDIIDNISFGQGPREKPYYEPLTKDRMTPWEKVMDGRARMAATPSAQPAPSPSATPAAGTPWRPRPEARGPGMAASGSAPQLRATPSIRGSGGASMASSQRRSDLGRSESMGTSLGGAVPGLAQSRTPPPAPAIPGDPVGSVFSRPSNL